MAQTPLSGDDPYLTAAQLWLYRDERTVLELLLDSDQDVATKDDAEDGATTAGGRLLAALQAASGEVEEHCLEGERYKPEDLAALTGNSKARLESLVADLAFWRLAKRRWPRLTPEEVSGATEALESLERLRTGATVFGTVEAADAGLPEVVTLDIVTTGTTVSEASRFFGRRLRGSET